MLRRLLRENAQSIVTQRRRRVAPVSQGLRRSAPRVSRHRRAQDRRPVLGGVLRRQRRTRARGGRRSGGRDILRHLRARLESAGGCRIASAGSTGDEPVDISNRLGPMGGLAAETGGALVKDASTHLTSAFATLVPDDRGYYLLGFEPGPLEAENLYRRVKVQVDAARRARHHPHGVRDRRAADERRSPSGAIDRALSAPFTQQGLKLDYTTYVGQSLTKGQQRVALSLLAELPVRQPDARDSRRRRAEPTSCSSCATAGPARSRRAAATKSRCPTRSDRFSTGHGRLAGRVRCAGRRLHHAVRRPRAWRHRRQRRSAVPGTGAWRVRRSPRPISLVFSPAIACPVRARGYTGGLLTGVTRLYAPTADGFSRSRPAGSCGRRTETLDPDAVGRVSDGTDR